MMRIGLRGVPFPHSNTTKFKKKSAPQVSSRTTHETSYFYTSHRARQQRAKAETIAYFLPVIIGSATSLYTSCHRVSLLVREAVTQPKKHPTFPSSQFLETSAMDQPPPHPSRSLDVGSSTDFGGQIDHVRLTMTAFSTSTGLLSKSPWLACLHYLRQRDTTDCVNVGYGTVQYSFTHCTPGPEGRASTDYLLGGPHACIHQY